MGGSLSKLNDVHVVMLGLDSAGKSTVLYRLKFDQYIDTLPTVGFNCEKVKGSTGKAKGVAFTIWDVGGQEKVRPLWRSYTRNTDGIVFVIDSVDLERMEEARVEILRTVRTSDVIGVPILVLANKQDLPSARSAEDIEKLLNLQEIASTNLYKVHGTCAVTGEGLDEGLEQLYQMILKRRKAIKHQKKGKKWYDGDGFTSFMCCLGGAVLSEISLQSGITYMSTFSSSRVWCFLVYKVSHFNLMVIKTRCGLF